MPQDDRGGARADHRSSPPLFRAGRRLAEALCGGIAFVLVAASGTAQVASAPASPAQAHSWSPVAGTAAPGPGGAVPSHRATQPVQSVAAASGAPATAASWQASPAAQQAHTGAPYELRAPSVHIDVPVIPVDLTRSGQMAAPEGPPGDASWHEGFWYDRSSVPGDPGTATLAGHLDDTNGRPAAFWNLHNLRAGDVLSIFVRSKNRWVRFRVTDVHVYTDQQASSKPVTDRLYGYAGDGRAQGIGHLSLITCAGTWHRGSGYDHRFIAFTQRIDG